MALLEVIDLEVGYGRYPVLHGISFEVEAGETCVLFGLNGAGKTTTVTTIAGLLKPTRGQIMFDGEPIGGRPPASLVSKGVSLSPEGRRVFPRLTVDQNLKLGAWARRQESTVVREQRELVFDYFPRLAERVGQVAGTLSGGEQQMLAIGRALMSRPRLLLVDEASLGLSPTVAKIVFEVMSRINDDGDHGAHRRAERRRAARTPTAPSSWRRAPSSTPASATRSATPTSAPPTSERDHVKRSLNLSKLGGQLGVGLCVAGLLLVFLGWNGAASRDRVPAQFPYLLSGGIAGLCLVVDRRRDADRAEPAGRPCRAADQPRPAARSGGAGRGRTGRRQRSRIGGARCGAGGIGARRRQLVPPGRLQARRRPGRGRGADVRGGSRAGPRAVPGVPARGARVAIGDGAAPPAAAAGGGVLTIGGSGCGTRPS